MIQAVVDQLSSQLEELTNALAATYNQDSSSKLDAVTRLATAKEQFMEACSQLRDQLVQLRQAVMLSPQQFEDILKQQQQQQAGAPKSRTQTRTGRSPAPDSMDVDQPQQQGLAANSAPEVVEAITQQHAEFLAQLAGGPS